MRVGSEEGRRCDGQKRDLGRLGIGVAEFRVDKTRAEWIVQ